VKINQRFRIPPCADSLQIMIDFKYSIKNSILKKFIYTIKITNYLYMKSLKDCIMVITEKQAGSIEFAKLLNDNFDALQLFMESRENIVATKVNSALGIVKDLRKGLKEDFKKELEILELKIDSRFTPLEKVLESLIKELNPTSKELLLDELKKRNE